MRCILLASFIIFTTGCGSNSDGSDKTTYSSCKITSSNAILASDRNHDLSQCWNAPNNGYESQGDAIQWCEKQVNSYISNRYLFGHSVKYTAESTYCP